MNDDFPTFGISRHHHGKFIIHVGEFPQHISHVV